jgi:hypothetical protein
LDLSSPLSNLKLLPGGENEKWYLIAVVRAIMGVSMTKLFDYISKSLL